MNKEEDQYKVLIDRIDKLEKLMKHQQRGLDLIGGDLEKDRGDLNNFVLRLGAVENIVKALLDSQAHREKRLKDQVEDIVDDAVGELKEQAEGIKDSADDITEAIKVNKVQIQRRFWPFRKKGVK